LGDFCWREKIDADDSRRAGPAADALQSSHAHYERIRPRPGRRQGPKLPLRKIGIQNPGVLRRPLLTSYYNPTSSRVNFDPYNAQTKSIRPPSSADDSFQSIVRPDALRPPRPSPSPPRASSPPGSSAPSASYASDMAPASSDDFLQPGPWTRIADQSPRFGRTASVRRT
ncbi:uncharacterized protein A4U43_C03F21410, partial [Asparagus officinalis]